MIIDNFLSLESIFDSEQINRWKLNKKINYQQYLPDRQRLL